MQPQINIGAIVAAVVEAMKEQGLVVKNPEAGGESTGTPDTGDTGSTTE